MNVKLTLAATAAIGLASCAVPPPAPMMMDSSAPIVQICGPGSHVGQDGNCHPEREHFVRECPLDMHPESEDARCRPN